MFGIGVPELILILIIGLVVFGPGKLPEVGRAVGKGLREFRKASSALTATLNAPDPPAQPASPAAPAAAAAQPAQQTVQAATETEQAPAAAPAAPVYEAPTQESVRQQIAEKNKVE